MELIGWWLNCESACEVSAGLRPHVELIQLKTPINIKQSQICFDSKTNSLKCFMTKLLPKVTLGCKISRMSREMINQRNVIKVMFAGFT